MRVGVPRELKNHETRVGLTPETVAELIAAGHDVVVEASAGTGAGLADEDYVAAGAAVTPSADRAWDADLVVKVKEPIRDEWHRMRRGQVLFTYLHLAADPDVARAVLDSGITAFAYETVQRADRSLPLLAPMSAVAGRLATQVGAQHLMAPFGGSGVLLGGVDNAPPASVVVLGGGIAGSHAADLAAGLRARVEVLDIDPARLANLPPGVSGTISTPDAIAALVPEADLVIGTALVPGARAPKLVTLDLVARMRPGSVLVDVAIDQGGCFEGSRPTTHDAPTFRVHDALYYCVTNMPAAVPRTATLALDAATRPYVLALAGGWESAIERHPELASGLNAHDGRVVHPAVAAALDLGGTSLHA
ncbi:MAG TPA: alanine dehydrogenase [Aeromicrobium sp.]|nr:alanine dehydrogenase [Aeromicrobium sp.]